MSGWKVGRIKVTSGYTPAPTAQTAAAASPAARDPATDRARLLEIQAATQARDFARAAGLAEAALKAGLEHPMVLNLAALKCQQEGRFEEALAVLRRAIEIAPQDIGARNAAGLVLTRLERYPEALAAFDGVLDLQPDFAGAHCARGATLESMGRLQAAECAYNHALELEPENLGAAQGLANLLSRRGDHAQARPLAEAVLEAQPNFPDAVMVLAAADAAEGYGERAQRRLELLAGDERLTPHQRALAQGQLGDVLDAQDLPAEAFQAYAACNLGLARAYGPLHGQGVSAVNFARAMLDELDRLPPESWAGADATPAADGPRTHVFRLGFPGSGRRLERTLAGHPEVEVLTERQTLIEAQRAFLAQPADLARLTMATSAELAPLRAAYWDRVRGEGAEPTGKVFIDSDPLHIFQLPLILKLFPDAQILLARRDPRDVVLNSYRQRFAMSRSTYQLLTLLGAAAYYDAAMRLADRLQPAMAARIHVVCHEALVGDDAGALGEVWAFLGLARAEQPVPGSGAEEPGGWRRYKDQLAPVLPVLAPWVDKYGYDAA